MPTPDYSKSCIYMLRHKDDTELENIYIGSTTNFRLRKCNHKSCCCNPYDKDYNLKKYQYIRANGGWEEWIMVWLEDYPCESKRELYLREDQVMLEYQNRLNDKRASRTLKQYKEDNKEQVKKKKKEWYENNKVKLLNKNKEKTKCNICGCEITKVHLKKHQETKKCQSHLTNS